MLRGRENQTSERGDSDVCCEIGTSSKVSMNITSGVRTYAALVAAALLPIHKEIDEIYNG